MDLVEDYVSFETAKLLKEKGFFDEICSCFYFINGAKTEPRLYVHRNLQPDFKNNIACPTLQMAMKWLREVHNIHIALVPYVTKDKKVVYGYQVSILMTVIPLSRAYNSYEEAGDAAVKDCLENLI